MKKVTFFLLSSLFLGVIFSLASLLLPSQVTVTKSIMVQANEKVILNQIDVLRNWKDWFPTDSILWQSEDPQTIIVINSKGNKQFKKIFTGKEHSSLFQLIDASKRTTTLEFLLIPHNSNFQITLHATTQFQWYPWEKFRGIFLDKMTGPFYEQLLQNLKKASEK